VILTGKQKDVESIIAASDVGLLCTYSEGISNFIIECMALQKPVISTDITGASKEIILEGKTGYCIRRNANEIVILINSLLDNESLRTSMGKTGKERIYEHFSIERMGKEFELLYENTLLTHRKR
jgi:glycosyltransferase involved in cell wall biosynthesis